MISTHEYAATLLEGAGHDLMPKGGRITMDEGWAPHVQARLTVPIPSETVQELLDPREARRIQLDCTATYHPLNPAPTQSRAFNLGLRGRRIGHRAGTIELELASDEALLMDEVLLADAPNRDALDYQDSLRAMIDAVVLSRIGAALEAGGPDTPFRVLSDATNLIPNPALETGIGSWLAAGNCALAWSTAAHTGTHALAFQATAAGAQQVNATPLATYLSVTAGKTYQWSVWGRKLSATPAATTLRVGIQWFNTSNVQIGTDLLSTAVALSSSYARYHVIGEAPVGAVKARAIVLVLGALNNLEATALDDALFMEGDRLQDAFSGDTPDTDEYAYQWTGTAGASTSTRAALIDRSPQMLDWEPGDSAWDFIQPVFQTAGLRLFCDEQRRWFLVDASYIAGGQTQLAVGVNTTEADDRIDRDNDEWCDAALVVYRWNDQTDTPTVRYDWYAEPGHTKVRVMELRRAFTGPGFAEYIVKRAAGKGRQITASAVSQYQAQPGQPVTITLPSTPIQTGLIQSVEWNLDNDEMTVQSRGLTDTPPDAWIFGSPDISWLDVPLGMTWNTFDWSGI